MFMHLYSWALRAFPLDVREDHGHEMREAFTALLNRQRATEGDLGAALFAVRATVDAVREGVGERFSRRREDGRTMMGMLDDLVTDLRLTLRGLRRTPGQAATLVMTLGLGVGAATAIFSLLHAVLLAPLPYPEPDQLISVRHLAAAVDGAGPNGPGGADILDYMAGAPSVEAFGGIQTLETNLNDDQGAARVTMGWTTPDFFRVVGDQAALGRALRPDDWAGADRAQMEDPNFTPPPMAVMLSHALWTTRFGRDPDVLGSPIRLNGQAMEVVGVLPAGFTLMLPADAEVSPTVDAIALMPVPLSGAGRGTSGLDVIARLVDGATVEQARREMEGVAAELRVTHEQHAQFGTEVLVDPLHDLVVVEAKPLLWTLFGAVALLLLIAATNVANLLVVRSASREREFAVRAALGVARGRIVRQLLAESLVVGVLGTAAGLLLADWTVSIISSVRPGELPRMDAVSLNAPVLMFSVAVSLGVVLLFGLMPAVTSARANGRLLVSGRGSGAGARASVRLRRVLIVSELAVSVVLIAGAGLLLRSFSELRQVDTGFMPEGVVAIDAALPFFGYRDDAVRASFFAELQRQASDLPGVQAAGMTAALPLERGSGGSWLAPYGPNGDDIDLQSSPRARVRPLSPGAFEALGMELREGRTFTSADEQPSDLVPVVIDAAVADENWPDGAIGRTLQVAVAGYTGQSRQVTGRVVGVIEPSRFISVGSADPPTIFIPYYQYTPVDGTLVIRSDSDPVALAADVREIVSGIDAGVPVFSVRRFNAVVNQATAQSRYAMMIVGLFAAAALLLAAVGLYGVISTLVQQRTREIGVRLALGAKHRDIYRMVSKDGLELVVPGMVLGLVGAALLAPATRSLLYGVGPLDPAALIGTAVLLGAVGWLASVLPARRAAKMDPVRALGTD
jgi:putative ABC transport system permease protein